MAGIAILYYEINLIKKTMDFVRKIRTESVLNLLDLSSVDIMDKKLREMSPIRALVYSDRQLKCVGVPLCKEAKEN